MFENDVLDVIGPDGIDVAEVYLRELPGVELPSGFTRQCGVPTWCAVRSFFGTVEYRPALVKYHHIRWTGSPRWTYLQLGRYTAGGPLPDIPYDVREWALKDQRLVLVSMAVIGDARNSNGVVGTVVFVRVHAIFEYQGHWIQVIGPHALQPLELEAAMDALAGLPHPEILLGDV